VEGLGEGCGGCGVGVGGVKLMCIRKGELDEIEHDKSTNGPGERSQIESRALATIRNKKSLIGGTSPVTSIGRH